MDAQPVIYFDFIEGEVRTRTEQAHRVTLAHCEAFLKTNPTAEDLLAFCEGFMSAPPESGK